MIAAVRKRFTPVAKAKAAADGHAVNGEVKKVQ